MKEFFETAIAFFSELTWARLRGLLILLAIVALSLIIFDSYTSYFTLSRLGRAAQLVAQVQTIGASPGARSPELDEAYKNLCSQVSEAVKAKPWTLRLNTPNIQISHSRLLKFAAAFTPWMLLSFVMLRDVFRKRDNVSWSGFFGILIMGGFFGLVGLALPTIWWPWFNLVIYPALPFFVVVILGVVIALNSAKKGSTASTTTINKENTSTF